MLGGGRYDDLLSYYNPSASIPAIGLGMGDIIVVQFMKQLDLFPRHVMESGVDNYIIPYNSHFYHAATQVASVSTIDDHSKFSLTVIRCCATMARVQLYKWVLGRSRKSRMHFAEAASRGAQRVIFIAEKEWTEEKVVIKYLHKKDENREARQIIVPLSQLLLQK